MLGASFLGNNLTILFQNGNVNYCQINNKTNNLKVWTKIPLFSYLLEKDIERKTFMLYSIKTTRLTALVASIAIILSVVNIFEPSTAQAQDSSPTVTISQGQQVLIPNQGICTVGYVDKTSHRAYLADHCLNDRGQQKSPVVVRDLKSGEALGKATPVGKMGIDGGGDPMQDPRFDVNFIQLNPQVKVGENKFSGDNRVNAYDIEQGDEVCVFSSRRNKTYCGSAWSTVGSVIKVHIPGGEADKAVTFGDSGGPAWIPGKGFIGVLVSMGGKTIWYTSIDTRDCTTEQVVDRLDPEGFGKKTCPVGEEYADISPHNHVVSPTPSQGHKPLSSISSVGSSSGSTAAVFGAIAALLMGIASLVSFPGLSEFS